MKRPIKFILCSLFTVLFVVSGGFLFKSTLVRAEGEPSSYVIRGASARIANDGKSGLKFNSYLSAQDYESVVKAKNAKTGIIVLPGDLCDDYDITLQTPQVYSVETTDLWSAFNEGDYDGYSAELYLFNIPAADYGRELVARGYYESDGKTYYTKPCVRSLSFVAAAALKDSGAQYNDEQIQTLNKYSSVATVHKFGADNVCACGEKFGFAPIELTSAGNNLTLPFGAKSIDELAIDGKTVSEFTLDSRGITINDFKTVLGIADVYKDARDKTVSITSGGKTLTTVVKFASKIITQADLGNDPNVIPQKFNSIIFVSAVGYQGYYLLGEDLDFYGGVAYSTNSSNISAPKFQGTFDGMGYSISNYVVKKQFNALFGNVYTTGTVKNLAVKNVSVEGSSNWLGVVACANLGTISDVYAEYSVSATGINNNNPAGMVARNDGTIRNCIAKVTVASDYAYKTAIGAIAGYSATDKIYDCFAIVSDEEINIMNARGTTPIAKVPTCQAFTSTDDFFAALAANEISVANYCEYWNLDTENKLITIANK